MKKLIEIARRRSPHEGEYRQTFAYEYEDEQETVASALRALNERAELVDVDGKAALPIRWECACLQKKCGACAMRINGSPALACNVRLNSCKKQTIVLEPLRKFAVVADLIVERKPLFDTLQEAEVWLTKNTSLPAKHHEIAFEASRCLQCGCCLEVCPNFSAQNSFGGMATMVPLARLLAEASPAERSRLAQSYRDYVYGGCGKSLSCHTICPAEIDISTLMSRSNAAALWRRWGS